MNTIDLFERMLEKMRWTLSSLADEVEPLEQGWVVRTRSLPKVWSLNAVIITSPTTLAEATTLADLYQADLSYRHIVFEDQSAGHDLEEPFASLGWRVEREVYMALAAPLAADMDTDVIVELSEDQSLELMRRWTLEEFPGTESDVVEQLAERSRREGRLWGERRFGVVGADGSPLALTKLRSDGSVAWVEDVFTAPEARRRGYARLLVTHATALAAEADPEFAFIVADDNDWPKQLYASVGFRPVGRTRIMHRSLE